MDAAVIGLLRGVFPAADPAALVEVTHSTCDAMGGGGGGGGGGDVLGVLLALSHIDVTAAAHVVTAAVTYYCPQYTGALARFVETGD